MKCGKCGREIKDGSKFCRFCGTKQTLDILFKENQNEQEGEKSFVLDSINRTKLLDEEIGQESDNSKSDLEITTHNLDKDDQTNSSDSSIDFEDKKQDSVIEKNKNGKWIFYSFLAIIGGLAIGIIMFFLLNNNKLSLTDEVSKTESYSNSEGRETDKNNSNEEDDSQETKSEENLAKDTWLCIKEEYYNANTREIYSQIFYDYIYDENGLMIESQSRSGEDLASFTRYSYDINSNCILESHYTVDSLVNGAVYFEYDIERRYNNNELVKEFHYSAGDGRDDYVECLYEGGLLKERNDYLNNEISSKEVYEYSEGMLKEKDSYLWSRLHSKEVYEYNDGVLVKLVSSDENDWNDLTIKHYEYDSSGNLVKILYEDIDGTLSGLEITYEYNERGEKIRCIEDYPDYLNNGTDDNYQQDLFYEYEYDENGNLTKDIHCDEQWNPMTVTEYTYIREEECDIKTINDYIGLYRLGTNSYLRDEPYIDRVRLKQGGNLDRIHCDYNVSGSYNEKVNIILDINDIQLKDSIEFIDSSELKYLYAVDLNVHDDFSNIIAVIIGEDDTRESIIYAYDENNIIRIGEMRGAMDIYEANGEGVISTNESLAGGIYSIGKFVAHYTGTIDGLELLSGTTKVGHFVEENHEKKYNEGFSFQSYADLKVYQDPDSNVLKGVIPAGTEISMIYYKPMVVVYNGYNVSDDAFYVTGDGVTGWTTNTGIREVAQDYYAVG